MYLQRYVPHFPAAGEVVIFDRSWYGYSAARDAMLDATSTEFAPWHILRSDDKKRARLNCIEHLLSCVPYRKAKKKPIELPKRSRHGSYDDQATLADRTFVPEKY